MQLNATLANQIVAKLAGIIHHSVNVIDDKGLIIGSSDHTRIQQQHDGAILVLNNESVLEIDQNTANHLQGVRPGINLPIYYQQQLVGVVGVSGEPEVVRTYGTMVKSIAELMIEQAMMLSQIQWNKRHREELVLQLITDEQPHIAQLEELAQRLSLDLKQPRVAAILKVIPKDGKQLSLEALQHLVHLLEEPERDNLVAITSVSNHEVVVLKPVKLEGNTWSREIEQQRVNKLLTRVTKAGTFTIKIVLGNYFPDIEGLAKSYQTALSSLDYLQLISNNKDNEVLFYQDHLMPVLLMAMKDDSWRYQQLVSPLNQLKEHDARGLLIKTLKVYFSQNCDQIKTCDLLHIHRNTLRYRLEKIEQETEMKLSNINDKLHLYIASLYL